MVLLEQIVYINSNGLNIDEALPLYPIVDFSESTLNPKLINGSPTTHIPIPTITDRCEKLLFHYQDSYESMQRYSSLDESEYYYRKR